MPIDLQPILEIVEALIEAHKAAKLEGDLTSLALIEAALSHAGDRLRKQSQAHAGRDRAYSEERGGGDDGHR